MGGGLRSHGRSCVLSRVFVLEAGLGDEWKFHETRAGVGDVVLINRLAYDVGKPVRFDVVVFEQGRTAAGDQEDHRTSRRDGPDQKWIPSISMGNS